VKQILTDYLAPWPPLTELYIQKSDKTVNYLPFATCFVT